MELSAIDPILMIARTEGIVDFDSDGERWRFAIRGCAPEEGVSCNAIVSAALRHLDCGSEYEARRAGEWPGEYGYRAFLLPGMRPRTEPLPSGVREQLLDDALRDAEPGAEAALYDLISPYEGLAYEPPSDGDLAHIRHQTRLVFSEMLDSLLADAAGHIPSEDYHSPA